ncbi:TetR/AcrR family transcriptional regulator [Neobacillus sp. MM2021_6]|uniref:TetR/AcrR family transcriptional regulator n=1 Tax=Bacillaceae TaxID=186817 RepID=UPI00140C134F|nr:MULTISPECIES: TetR/AcrR family transcriptional regulator [Bacillaceae]MBO0962268.1 TetR/AcrR family transcriptional regulator [Neobacillus sp. MM2021_6]NHC19417.1 TetR/AcrR family transcriptional regulator [Bacillus sp. MM2020_4]
MGRDRKFNTVDLFLCTKKLIIETGYEGFTIGQVAKQLHVSRAAIYKYYQNKDELLLDFMLEEMKNTLTSFSSIPEEFSFLEKINLLLQKIFLSKDLHLILGIQEVIPTNDAPLLDAKKNQLSLMHRELYKPLIHIVQQGKTEGHIDMDLPNEMLLGFIFQSISIPNHSGMDTEQVLEFTKKLILNGILKNK